VASDTNVSDDIGWSDLRTAASDGQLMLNPGIAQTCAQHVEAMLNSILGVNSWIANNLALAGPPIAATPSGTDLHGAFDLKMAIEMETRMTQHQTVLTDMGNTFVAAGKAYESSETDSKVSFDGISFDNPSGTPPSGVPVVQAILPDQPAPSYQGTVMEKVDITPEDGSNLTWQQLYAIGQSIDPGAVANTAGIWYWLANDLGGNFATLRSNIDAAATQWTGTGAARAISATQRYTTASNQFTSDMNKIGDVLLYTSRWLQQTKNSMPTTPDPPTTSGSGYQSTAADIAALTAPYQSAFTTNYTDPFGGSSNNLVVLPQPEQVTRTPTGSDNGTTIPAGPKYRYVGIPAGPKYRYVGPSASRSSGQTSGNTTTTTSPDTTSRVTTSPVTTSPVTTSPVTTSPVTTDPVTTSPDTTNPDTTNPVTTSPDTTNPDTTSPDTTNPDTASPTTTPASAIPSIPSTTNPFGTSSAKTPSAGDLAGKLTKAEKGMASGLGGGLGGGGFGGGSSETAAERPSQGSKLFPRSSLSEEGPGRAGATEEEGQEPGFPMGGAGRGKKDEEKERKNSDLLNSTEHLDEAIGKLDPSVRPVLDR